MSDDAGSVVLVPVSGSDTVVPEVDSNPEDGHCVRSVVVHESVSVSSISSPPHPTRFNATIDAAIRWKPARDGEFLMMGATTEGQLEDRIRA